MANHNYFSIAKSHKNWYIWRNKSMKLVGRSHAKSVLDSKLESKKSELVAILGRRRIGKTYLVKEHLRKEIVFQFTGLFKSNLDEHMERFQRQLSIKRKMDVQTPKSWYEAFDRLSDYLISLKSKKKKVVFLDEFPWMATNRSRFLAAFTDFWNNFASSRKDLMIIICGSSASWMINKVLKNKGGLHNRVTERITLRSFSLAETEEFLRTKKLIISKYDILKLYMAIGGIPFYLDQLKKGESVVQAIDRICFHRDGLLRNEYDELMSSLFNNSDKHERIIRELQKHPKGIQRDKLLSKAKIKSGGGATSILDELESSDFISTHIPYKKKSKERLYKLKDHYILFYFKFIKPNKKSTKGIWNKIFESQSYQSWSGLAFENICLEHSEAIEKGLRIDGIHSQKESWHHMGDEEHDGAQIDLLIDRADQVINVCEIKFSNSEYTITSSYAKQIRNKVSAFKHFTKTRKSLFPTMITTFGLKENVHSKELIQQSIGMKILFEQREI